MSYAENVEPIGEVLPDDPAELWEMFSKDRSRLMRLAARLTYAAQTLELTTTANFERLDEVAGEIDDTKKRLALIALKLGRGSETLPDLINRDIEAAS